MDTRRRLLYLFNLRADEASLISLLLGLGVVGFLAMVMVRTAAYSLFLAEFDYRTLPYVFVAAALFAVTISILSPKAMQRFPLDTVLLVHGGVLLSLVRALGSIHDKQAVALLLSQMTQPDEQTRTQFLAALCRHEFQVDAALQATVADQLEAEVRQGAWFAPWTKATAIDAVARLPAPELVETVRTSLYARDSVVRETAPALRRPWP